jgi:DUF1016 N-terminal domain
VSGQSASELTPLSSKKGQTLSDVSSGGQEIARLRQLAVCFPLPWSHYVRLMALSSEEARRFYESEALRCGWSVRQLDRQISSQFYERTAQWLESIRDFYHKKPFAKAAIDNI